MRQSQNQYTWENMFQSNMNQSLKARVNLWGPSRWKLWHAKNGEGRKGSPDAFNWKNLLSAALNSWRITSLMSLSKVQLLNCKIPEQPWCIFSNDFYILVKDEEKSEMGNFKFWMKYLLIGYCTSQNSLTCKYVYCLELCYIRQGRKMDGIEKIDISWH